MYKAKGKQNALEGYFVRCKSDVTNYHEMPVELWIHILFFFLAHFNRTCVMLTRSEQAVISYTVFYYFIFQEPDLESFSLSLVRSRRG